MKGPLGTELGLLFAATGIGAAMGYVLGFFALGVVAGLSVVVVRHLRNLLVLSRWMAVGGEHPMAESSGLWRLVFRRAHSDRSSANRKIEDLRQSRDRYMLVTKALPEAAVTVGRSGQIDMINGAALRLLGLKEPDDIGQPIVNFIRDPRFAELLEEADPGRVIEVSSPGSDSARLSLRVVPYGESDKRLLLAQDVTRLNRLEQIRRDFIANVSHELKSPLTVIIGYAEWMRDDDESQKKWAKPLLQIEQQSQRMKTIVEDLLKLSALETTEVTDDALPVDIPALIRSLHGDAMELCGADSYTFTFDIDDELMLTGNYNELYSAFSNLVFNAISYTPAGGKIAIRWYASQTGRARFTVEDNGIGIAPRHIKRLTERFYRVDKGRSRQRGGTGLGLAIVKHVLKRHDAKLVIKSEIDVGSKFDCEFPTQRLVARRQLNTA